MLWADPFKGIVFFPNVESRPSNDSFAVNQGDLVPYCIALDEFKDDLFQKLKDQMIGFEFILEDQSNPPVRIRVSTGHRFKLAVKNMKDACYSGSFKIPQGQKAGLYQVADFMVVMSDQSFYSLREYLFSFKHVDEIVIENKNGDAEAPYLVKLGHYGPEIQYYKTATRETVIVKPRYFIQIADDKSGVHKKSVKAYVRLDLNGQAIDIQELNCKKSGQMGLFACGADFKTVLENWYNQSLETHLIRLDLIDKMRNRVVITDQELLKSKLDDSSLSIRFVKGKQIGKHRDRKISRYLDKPLYFPEYQEPIIEEESLPNKSGPLPSTPESNRDNSNEKVSE